EGVRAAHLPDDRPGLAVLGRHLAGLGLDAIDLFGPLAPELPGEIRAVLPAAIADPFRRVAAPDLALVRTRAPELDVGPAVILERHQMPPAPDQRLIRPQDHVHG